MSEQKPWCVHCGKHLDMNAEEAARNFYDNDYDCLGMLCRDCYRFPQNPEEEQKKDSP